ncbi:MAG: transcriptional repressor LexA [bacterium]|nr:transcriptional repressor LexA [bacterium]
MLTPTKKKVIDFINLYIEKKKVSPSLENIRKGLRLKSVSTIHQHVKELEESGYLQKESGRHRSIKVSKQEEMVSIPLLGTIAAGEPIEAIQEKESIAISKNKIPNSGDVYALRVSGNSMVEENINDGDIVLIKQQITAENGQRVVGLTDNHKTILKRYYKRHGMIRLQSENKDTEPIIIRNNRNFVIQGVVIDVIKNPASIEFIKRLYWIK